MVDHKSEEGYDLYILCGNIGQLESIWDLGDSLIEILNTLNKKGLKPYTLHRNDMTKGEEIIPINLKNPAHITYHPRAVLFYDGQNIEDLLRDYEGGRRSPSSLAAETIPRLFIYQTEKEESCLALEVPSTNKLSKTYKWQQLTETIETVINKREPS